MFSLYCKSFLFVISQFGVVGGFVVVIATVAFNFSFVYVVSLYLLESSFVTSKIIMFAGLPSEVSISLLVCW